MPLTVIKFSVLDGHGASRPGYSGLLSRAPELMISLESRPNLIVASGYARAVSLSEQSLIGRHVGKLGPSRHG